MPNTPDHKVEMHRLAQQRIAAGLPSWDRKISLADVFRNEDMSFGERRDAIVNRLRNSGWLDGRDEDDELRHAVDDLAQAHDADEFDDVWNVIYGEADYDRVWIGTV